MHSRIIAIEATGLFGAYDLSWHPLSGVNILAGGNGSGKSTVLRAVVRMVREGTLGALCASLVRRLEVHTKGGTPRVIANFDPEMASVRFDFDQVGPERRALFCDLIDRLMGSSHKTIDRDRVVRHGELGFVLRDRVELPYEALSSGEQAVVRLFYYVLIHPEASVLVLDEPEISLQIEWQKVLLEEVLRLSPHLQVLVATHSPAVVMDGWVDRVVEISSLMHNI